MKSFIRKVGGGEHLSRDEAAAAMRQIMCGQATEAQIAGLLIALRINGENPDELLGFTEVMREMSVHIRVDDPDAIDLCGTGGDGSGTFNISTVAAFVTAGAGATVAKHGNRSVSSRCGSADLISALGIPLDAPPQRVEACINTVGIGFLFAPLFHPAFRHASKPRSELGVKTAFNLLGPMANPAGVRTQLAGAFSSRAASAMSSVYESLKADHVFVVNSHDGLDEISLSKPTTVFEIRNGHSTSATMSPDSFGLPPADISSITGGDAGQNAGIAMKILLGERIPHRNVVVANAAVGLMAAGKAASVQDGVRLAQESIDSGRALQKLNRMREFVSA